MEPISVGDQVLITGAQDNLKTAVGRTGIVMSVLSEGDWILVKFPERFDSRLHGGGLLQDPDKCCWGFSPENARNSIPLQSMLTPSIFFCEVMLF